MTSDQIVKLVQLVEVQFVGLLIQNNICEYIEKPTVNFDKKKYNNLKNIRILEPHLKEIPFEEITLEMVSQLRDCYPKGSDRKGTPNVIRTKLVRFLGEHPELNFEKILNITQSYVRDKIVSGETGFLVSLDYIFYKRENDVEKSFFVSLIEKYNNDVYNKREDLRSEDSEI